MNDDKQLRAIFQKNFLASFLLSIVPCFLLLTTFLIYVSYWNDKQITEVNTAFAESGGNVVNSALSEAETFAMGLANNLEVQAYIASDGDEYFANKCRNLFSSFRIVNGNIDDVFIVHLGADRILYSTGPRQLLEEERQDFEFNNRNVNQTKYCFLKKNGTYPYLLRIIRNVSLGSEQGAVVVDVNIENLGNTFRENNHINTKKHYILSADGEILYGDDLAIRFMQPFSQFANEKGSNLVELDGNDYLMTKSRPLRNGLVFVSLLLSSSEREAIITAYWRLLLPSIIFLLLISIFFSLLVTKHAIRPISALIYAVTQKKGDKQIKISPEIQYILDNLKGTLRSGRESEAVLNVRLMRLKIEQIRALEAQINPHFLYNTLDSINWDLYEKMGRNNDISQRIGKLSQMLRMGFQADEYIVSFEDELRHAKAYKELLQYGEANSAEVLFQVSKEALQKRTVKFILQPLIENAIRHGLKEENGKIWVQADVAEDCLVIQIKDNGIGMNPQKLHQLNRELSESFGSLDEELRNILDERIDISTEESLTFSKKSSWTIAHRKKSGVGLKNVNNRIRLAFGEAYGIELSLNEPCGLIVTVIQPIKE